MKKIWVVTRYWTYKTPNEERLGIYTSKAKAIKAMKPLISKAVNGASLHNIKLSKEWYDHQGCVSVSFVNDDISYQFVAEQVEVL